MNVILIAGITIFIVALFAFAPGLILMITRGAFKKNSEPSSHKDPEWTLPPHIREAEAQRALRERLEELEAEGGDEALQQILRDALRRRDNTD